MIGSLPKLASPRSKVGQQSRAVRSSSAHRRGAECLDVCPLPAPRRHPVRAAGRPPNRCDNDGSVGQASQGCSPRPPLPDDRTAASLSYPCRESTARPEAAPCNHRDEPHPRGARHFLNCREGAPHRVPADDSLHAQKLRHNAVTAERRDMGISRVSGQDRQHRRAQNVARLGRVRTRVT